MRLQIADYYVSWLGWETGGEDLLSTVCQTEYNFVEKKAEVCGPKQMEK